MTHPLLENAKFWSIEEFEEFLNELDLSEEEKTLERLKHEEYVDRFELEILTISAGHRTLSSDYTLEIAVELEACFSEEAVEELANILSQEIEDSKND